MEISGVFFFFYRSIHLITKIPQNVHYKVFRASCRFSLSVNEIYFVDNLSQRLNETAQKQREKDIAEIKSLNAALGQLEDERENLETEKNR